MAEKRPRHSITIATAELVIRLANAFLGLPPVVVELAL
jgi:hypothetical protein